MASNRHKGDAFAKGVGEFLKSLGHNIQPEYQVRIGIGPTNVKTHKFDWGNESLLLECKAYDWTESRNVPSAKLTTVTEVMLYFLCAQKPFRKMLFMLATERRPKGNSETLAEYYLRMNGHLIPDDVEVYEFDPDSLLAKQLWPASDQSRQEISGTQEDLSSIDSMRFTEGASSTLPIPPPPLSSRMRGPIPPTYESSPAPVGASLLGALSRDCYENRLPPCC